MGWVARNFSKLQAPPQTLRDQKDVMTQAPHWRLQTLRSMVQNLVARALGTPGEDTQKLHIYRNTPREMENK